MSARIADLYGNRGDLGPRIPHSRQLDQVGYSTPHITRGPLQLEPQRHGSQAVHHEFDTEIRYDGFADTHRAPRPLGCNSAVQRHTAGRRAEDRGAVPRLAGMRHRWSKPSCCRGHLSLLSQDGSDFGEMRPRRRLARSQVESSLCEHDQRRRFARCRAG